MLPRAAVAPIVFPQGLGAFDHQFLCRCNDSQFAVYRAEKLHSQHRRDIAHVIRNTLTVHNLRAAVHMLSRAGPATKVVQRAA